MIPIEEILCFEPRGVISFVGGGGKTSLMFHLAGLLELSGLRVLTTTTTRIFVPSSEQSETVLVDSDPHTVLHLASTALKYSGRVTAAAVHQSENGKLKGFDPENISSLSADGPFWNA